MQYTLYIVQYLQFLNFKYNVYCIVYSMEESGDLSSLHQLLRNRLVRGDGYSPRPPSHTHTHTHSVAGSITINAKTTVHCSPGSSMVYTDSSALRHEERRTMSFCPRKYCEGEKPLQRSKAQNSSYFKGTNLTR